MGLRQSGVKYLVEVHRCALVAGTQVVCTGRQAAPLFGAACYAVHVADGRRFSLIRVRVVGGQRQPRPPHVDVRYTLALPNGAVA